MLIFIDESGDSGLLIEKGSSRFFTVSLVIFEENEEAEACDTRIELLKRELNWNKSNRESEFHFKSNSDDIRTTFLKAVAAYNFFYYGFIVNKDPKKLWGEGFKNKSSFYKYTCSLVFENAREKLSNATVIIDESGSLEFKNQLAKYLKRKMNNSDRLINKVKMQNSSKNNLLQLADYVAGCINRSITHKGRKTDKFRKVISHREIKVQMWPK